MIKGKTETHIVLFNRIRLPNGHRITYELRRLKRDGIPD